MPALQAAKEQVQRGIGRLYGGKGKERHYLLDEDEDLQETNQDLELIELIGLQNWLMLKLRESDSSATE